jgi:hypothetical protein
MRHNHPSTFAALSLFAACIAAQADVRLTKVPDVVRLPAAAGSNLLLEVECSAPPTAIWLAVDATSRDRVPLQPAGERRYQANLADPRIAGLLPAGRDQGELFVFAQVGNAVTHSAAVGWARNSADEAAARCVVRQRNGTTAIAAADRRTWLDPQQIESLELQGAGARQATAVARIDDVEVPLVRRTDQGLWILDNDGALRERLLAAAALEIEFRRGAQSTLFPFDLVPGKLALPDGQAKFVVKQRHTAPVPGSRNWLTVHIDDITMGRTLLDVTDGNGTVVVPQQFVNERDFVELPLAGERHVLVVDKLVNLLIGDDHAEFLVRPAAGFVPDRIGQLLRAVAASKDTFLREGAEYTGPVAAQFLLARLGGPDGRQTTVDKFVDELASRSSRTGEPYHVRAADGTVTTMQEWLRAELKRLESPPQQRGR